MGTAIQDLNDHGKFISAISAVDTVVDRITKTLVFDSELIGELCMLGARLLKQGLSLLNSSLAIRDGPRAGSEQEPRMIHTHNVVREGPHVV